MIKIAEYVRRGHPDRVCDIIADSLLDEFIKQDPMSRVAIEVFGCHGIITVGGEVTTNGYVDIQKVVKDVYREIGYEDEIGVQVNIIEQSNEIKNLADIGAGDSGIMIGYATNETPEMLPLEVALAKRICDKLDDSIGLLPDGKVQVSICDGVATDVVVAYQSKVDNDSFILNIIDDVLEERRSVFTKIKIIRFVKGGFSADTGLTGRKNVLWYGPSVPTGGGAFAGKDCTKVDRTGAYLARQFAVLVVKNLKKENCLVEVAYKIGDSKPLSIVIDGMIDTEIADNAKVYDLVNIINALELRKPIFKEASMKGHFGYGANWDKELELK
jgi:S-adenosylmethionine synthetase